MTLTFDLQRPLMFVYTCFMFDHNPSIDEDVCGTDKILVGIDIQINSVNINFVYGLNKRYFTTQLRKYSSYKYQECQFRNGGVNQSSQRKSLTMGKQTVRLSHTRTHQGRIQTQVIRVAVIGKHILDHSATEAQLSFH